MAATGRRGGGAAARLVELAAVAAGYGVLAAAFFLPVLGRLGSDVIGPPEDNMRYLWTLWWGHGALRGDLAGLLRTDMIFHPEGASLLYNDYSWYNLLLALPLRSFLGLPATYNALQLHSFVLAGLGAYLLCRDLGAGRPAAFAGGFVFAFSPMHVAHALHHMNISSLQWIPFFAWSFLRAVRGGGRRDELLAALFFLLNALCSWYHLVFTSYFVAGVVLWRARAGGSAAFRTASACALRATLPPLLLLSPWLVAMAAEGFSTGRAGAHGHDTFVVDLLGPIVPHYAHLLADFAPFDRANRSYSGVPWESVGYLGLPALLLAALAVARRAPGARAAAVGAAVALVLAMGSELHVGGLALPVPLPYRALEALPLLGNARSPGRAMAFAYLGLAVLVSGGLQELLHETRGRRRPLLAATAAGLLLLDYYTPVRESTPVTLPEAYAVITDDPDAGFAILELPLLWRANDRYMMYQTFHGIPIAGGQLPRKTRDSLVDRLTEDGFRGERDAVVAAGIKYIVVDESLFPRRRRHLAARYRALFAELGFPTVYEKGGTTVVRTYAPAGAPGR